LTDLNSPVVRRTQFVARNRRVVASMDSQGIVLRLEKTRQKHRVTWPQLWALAADLPGPRPT
jgi:hypothetical protein